MYNTWTDKYDDGKYIQEQNDHIRAVGGDGILLRAIKMHRTKNKPFFGVAGGSVNFLMNQDPFLMPEAKRKKFKLINVVVSYRVTDYYDNDIGGATIRQSSTAIKTKEFQAFNDVMIGGNMNSWIEFSVRDRDKIIRNFKGGGLIVSTAQGSTGINRNNGGVILPLSSHNWSVTGDKTNRRINYVIEPHKTIIKVTSRTPVTVWVDGANNVVSDVESVEISKGDTVTVLFNNYDSFKKKRM